MKRTKNSKWDIIIELSYLVEDPFLTSGTKKVKLEGSANT